MKKIYLPIALFIYSINVFSQKTGLQFEQAIKFYEAKEFDSALALFTKIYKKGKGSLDMIAKAHYNIAETYMQKKDTVNAKKIFEEILRSDYDDTDKGGIGSGIMGEPYALYKYHCCTYLAEIALAEKKYTDALEYTRMFIEDYPYRHFCGNEYEASAIYSAYMLARCYEGLDQTDRAIGILLKKSMYTGLANNDYLVDLLVQLLKKQRSVEEIKKEFERASASITERTKKTGKDKYVEYFTTIFEIDIALSSFCDYGDYTVPRNLKGVESYRFCFVNSYLYRSLMSN